MRALYVPCKKQPQAQRGGSPGEPSMVAPFLGHLHNAMSISQELGRPVFATNEKHMRRGPLTARVAAWLVTPPLSPRPPPPPKQPCP